MDIRTGDTVVVITGNDKGQKGKVIAVMGDGNRVLVEKLRLVKRHTKPGRFGMTQGGIVEKEAPIHISNVALVDPKTGEPTRIRMEIQKDGEKVRVAVGSGQVIDYPKE